MSASNQNLFIYGTLLVPKIWDAVSGASELIVEPAVLLEHRIARVKGGDFPVICESTEPGSIVTGAVRFDVPEAAMSRLDAYEDTFYVRENVEVICENKRVSAQVYRVPASLQNDLFSDECWSLDWFETHALDRYWGRHFGP